jgi:hypothetical protein
LLDCLGELRVGLFDETNSIIVKGQLPLQILNALEPLCSQFAAARLADLSLLLLQLEHLLLQLLVLNPQHLYLLVAKLSLALDLVGIAEDDGRLGQGEAFAVGR